MRHALARRSFFAITLGTALLVALLARPVAASGLATVMVESRDGAGNLIGGACYQVENAVGLHGPLCDDDGDGVIVFADLAPDDQRISMVSAPPGYQVAIDPSQVVHVGANVVALVVFTYAAVEAPVANSPLPRVEAVVAAPVAPQVPIARAPSGRVQISITPAPTCAGLVATIVGVPNPNGGPAQIAGTAGADVIVGTAGPDEIQGFGGDDVICGLEGNDVIDAGEGDDWVDAGGGDDNVYGHGGADALAGGDGDDVLKGRGGGDRLDGGAGRNDYCHGGTEHDKAINCETAVEIP